MQVIPPSIQSSIDLRNNAKNANNHEGNKEEPGA